MQNFARLQKIQQQCVSLLLNHGFASTVYKKTGEWYIEWQRMTASDKEWQRVVQQMIMSGNEWFNKWEQVVQQVTTNGND